MSDQLTEEQIQQISDALANGRKIQAIKIYRKATSLGLVEAKDFVEALIPKLKEQDPERYAALREAQKIGCGTTTASCLLLAVLIWMIAAVT